MNELREFDKRSKHFPLVDHFINSHNLISRQCMDIVRRKLTLVTIGTSRVKSSSSLFYMQIEEDFKHWTKKMRHVKHVFE